MKKGGESFIGVNKVGNLIVRPLHILAKASNLKPAGHDFGPWSSWQLKLPCVFTHTCVSALQALANSMHSSISVTNSPMSIFFLQFFLVHQVEGRPLMTFMNFL